MSKEELAIKCNELIPERGPLNTNFELQIALSKRLNEICYTKLNSAENLCKLEVAFDKQIPTQVVKNVQHVVFASVGIVAAEIDAKGQVIISLRDCQTAVVIPFKYKFGGEKPSEITMDWDERAILNNTAQHLHIAAGEGNSVLTGHLTFSNPNAVHQVDQFNRLPIHFAKTFQQSEEFLTYLEQTALHGNQENEFSSYMENLKNYLCLELNNNVVHWNAKYLNCTSQIEALATTVDAQMAQLIQSTQAHVSTLVQTRKQRINIVGSDIAIAWICYVLGGTIQDDGFVVLPIELAFANADMYFVPEALQDQWTDGADLTVYIPNGESEIFKNVCCNNISITWLD